jgi:hypothetical protein
MVEVGHVVLRAARRRPMEDHQPHPPHGRTQSREPQGKSDRGCDRQPIGQDNRGGGPRGYAAEKMIKGRKWCATLAGEHAERVSVAAPSIRRWRLRGRQPEVRPSDPRHLCRQIGSLRTEVEGRGLQRADEIGPQLRLNQLTAVNSLRRSRRR